MVGLIISPIVIGLIAGAVARLLIPGGAPDVDHVSFGSIGTLAGPIGAGDPASR